MTGDGAVDATQTQQESVLDGFVSREELAKQLGICQRTLDRWQALRTGPARVILGRKILYRLETVRRWLIEQEKPTDR